MNNFGTKQYGIRAVVELGNATKGRKTPAELPTGHHPLYIHRLPPTRGSPSVSARPANGTTQTHTHL